MNLQLDRIKIKGKGRCGRKETGTIAKRDGFFAASPRYKLAGRARKGVRKGFVPLTLAMHESQGASGVSKIPSANDRAVRAGAFAGCAEPSQPDKLQGEVFGRSPAWLEMRLLPWEGVMSSSVLVIHLSQCQCTHLS